MGNRANCEERGASAAAVVAGGNRGGSSRDSPLLHMFGGLLAGGTSTLLLYPMDLLKVRLQVNETYNPATRSSQFITEFVTLTNAYDKVLKERPKRGLLSIVPRRFIKYTAVYNGLGPSLMGNGLTWGGYFFTYESVKDRILNYKRRSGSRGDAELNSADYMAAACASGTIMVLMTNPIWLVKTRIQLQLPAQDCASPPSSSGVSRHRNYTGIVDGILRIVKEEGALSLYKGVVPALILVSHGVVQFGVYENMKKAFPSICKRKPNEALSVSERLQDSSGYLMMGAASKMVASTLTYPVQVVKTRIQQRSVSFEIVPSSAASNSAPGSTSVNSSGSSTTTAAAARGGGNIVEVWRSYTSVASTFKKIYAKEGFTGFFKGCLANSLRVAPNAAITFVVYEMFMDLCNLRRS